MHHVSPGTAHKRSLSLPCQSHESVRTGYQAHQDPAQGHRLAERPVGKKRAKFEIQNLFTNILHL